MRDKRLWALLAALIAAAGFALPIIALTDDDGDGRPDRVTVTIPLDRDERVIDPPGPAAPVVIDTNTTKQPDEAQVTDAPAAEGLGIHEDSRDETPPGVTPAEDDRVDRLADEIADDLDPKPVGGAQNYSCARQPVVNQSALSAARVGVALHITVSDPGSLDAIQSLFNRPSFGASSNYGFELYNGRCEQWVPENRKAWTQGAFNSSYVSIEIISKLRTTQSWLDTPALKNGTLAALVRDIANRHGAPLKLVDPSGCTPIAGITDHDRLDCGNDHVDVGNVAPNAFPWVFFIRQVQLGARPTITDRDRSSCRKIHAYRERPVKQRARGAQARQAARLGFVRRGGRRGCKAGRPRP